MASSCHINTARCRKASAVAGDPEKVFTQSVEKLQQRLEMCTRMRTFSEMKSILEEIIELVKLFFSDSSELVQLYMDGSVRPSLPHGSWAG